MVEEIIHYFFLESLLLLSLPIYLHWILSEFISFDHELNLQFMSIVETTNVEYLI